jgi:hypothetical protein
LSELDKRNRLAAKLSSRAILTAARKFQSTSKTQNIWEFALTRLSFTTRGFTEAEQSNLLAILTLSERALKAAWTFTPFMDSADIILVSLNTDAGREFWRQCPQDHRFVACTQDDEGGEARWKLRLSPQSPPSRQALLQLFNALGDFLAQAPPASTALPTPPTPEAASPATPPALPPLPEPEAPCPAPAQAAPAPGSDELFAPQSCLLGILQEALRSGQNLSLIAPSQPQILVCTETQSFYSVVGVEALSDFCALPAQAIQASPLTRAEIERLSQERKMSRQALDELLWLAALYGSQGRLLQGCAADTVLHLKHWPQVSHLPHYRAYLRVAAFMNQNAADLAYIAAATGMPLATVYDFHNACEILGLLERGIEPFLKKKEVNGALRNLYRMISTRLSHIGAED